MPPQMESISYSRETFSSAFKHFLKNNAVRASILILVIACFWLGVSDFRALLPSGVLALFLPQFFQAVFVIPGNVSTFASVSLLETLNSFLLLIVLPLSLVRILAPKFDKVIGEFRHKAQVEAFFTFVLCATIAAVFYIDFVVFALFRTLSGVELLLFPILAVYLSWLFCEVLLNRYPKVGVLFSKISFLVLALLIFSYFYWFASNIQSQQDQKSTAKAQFGQVVREAKLGEFSLQDFSSQFHKVDPTIEYNFIDYQDSNVYNTMKPELRAFLDVLESSCGVKLSMFRDGYYNSNGNLETTTLLFGGDALILKSIDVRSSESPISQKEEIVGNNNLALSQNINNDITMCGKTFSSKIFAYGTLDVKSALEEFNKGKE
jgi:hypothetical protein